VTPPIKWISSWPEEVSRDELPPLQALQNIAGDRHCTHRTAHTEGVDRRTHSRWALPRMEGSAGGCSKKRVRPHPSESQMRDPWAGTQGSHEPLTCAPWGACYAKAIAARCHPSPRETPGHRRPGQRHPREPCEPNDMRQRAPKCTCEGRTQADLSIQRRIRLPPPSRRSVPD
jgi:hypothetical protein